MTTRTESAVTRSLRPCAALLLASIARAQTSSTFTGLTDPFPGTYVSAVHAVNADGSVVVGYTYKPTSPDFGDHAFRWRRPLGFDRPGPSQDPAFDEASGVSASGNVIVGNTGHAQFGDQEAWVRVGNSRGHIGSPPGANFSTLLGVSSNGAIAVGYGGNQSNPNSAQAAYYNTANDSWTNLGFFPGGIASKATAANADGTVIVGWGHAPQYFGFLAFRRTALDGLVQLAGPEGWTQTSPTAVSADGNVIVGYDETSGTFPWRWTPADGITPIGDSPMWALGVSPDGQVIVGIDQRSGSNQPFIWDAAHGVRDLRQVLEGRGLGAAMQGWSLSGATAISQSGGVYAIAGEGGDPSGFIAGWVATLDGLDTPCPGLSQQPQSQLVPSGSPVVFGVVASGSPPLVYQWRLNGIALTDGDRMSGTSTPTLAISSVSLGDQGVYDVVVSNECGPTPSDPAVLEVYCSADFNADGFLDPLDYNGFINAFETGDMSADFNADGFLDPLDYNGFINAFEAGC